VQIGLLIEIQDLKGLRLLVEQSVLWPGLHFLLNLQSAMLFVVSLVALKQERLQSVVLSAVPPVLSVGLHLEILLLFGWLSGLLSELHYRLPQFVELFELLPDWLQLLRLRQPIVVQFEL
jgi:hypothetical protein